MQGLLHCVRPPGMEFRAIFTQKTATTQAMYQKKKKTCSEDYL